MLEFALQHRANIGGGGGVTFGGGGGGDGGGGGKAAGRVLQMAVKEVLTAATQSRVSPVFRTLHHRLLMHCLPASPSGMRCSFVWSQHMVGSTPPGAVLALQHPAGITIV
jgi:hypothetical protein